MDFRYLEIREDMTYVYKPLKILDKKEKVLRTKTIPMVKVLWTNHAVEEATGEIQSDMKEKNKKNKKNIRSCLNEQISRTKFLRWGGCNNRIFFP